MNPPTLHAATAPSLKKDTRHRNNSAETKPVIDRLPPHSKDSEQGIVGCMIAEPERCVDQYRARFSDNVERFYDLRNQEIARVILTLQKEHKGIDEVTISEELRARELLEQVGGIGYLSSLAAAVTSAENFPNYLDILEEKYSLRRSIQLCTEFVGRVYDCKGSDTHILLDELEADIQRVRNGVSGSGIKALLQERSFNPVIEPPPLRAIITLAGQPICTPGNLTTITAAAKAGKTATLGAMVAAMFPHSIESDLLGFKSDNPDRKAILWFDSEQSPDDYWHCVYRAVKRAGMEKPPEWFHGFCLTGLGHDVAWKCVKESIRLYEEMHGGILAVLLDGSADFVADVNDAEESNDFVAAIHGMGIKHDCPIISVVHFNPGGAKVRGHLGSQLERKSESNLALEKDANEVTVIYSTKQRRAPIPKSTGPRFKYDTSAGMHVSVECRREEHDEQERETLQELAEEIFGERPGMRYSEIISSLKSKFPKLSDSTLDRRFKRMRDLGVIKKCVGQLWERTPYGK